MQFGASGFNPRAREGATPPLPAEHMPHLVSIRAPVRARPRHQIKGLLRFGSFNPRAREGATVDAIAKQVHLTEVSIHAPVRARH